MEVTLTAAYRERLEIAVKAVQSSSSSAGQDTTRTQGRPTLPSRLPDSVRGFLRPLPQEATKFSDSERALLFKHPGMAASAAAAAALKLEAATAASLALAAAGRGPYAIALAEAMSAAGTDELDPEALAEGLLSLHREVLSAEQLKDEAKEAIQASMRLPSLGTRQVAGTAVVERKPAGVMDQAEGADAAVAGGAAVQPGVNQQGGLLQGAVCCSSHGTSAAAVGESHAAAAASCSSSSTVSAGCSSASALPPVGPSAAAVGRLGRSSGQGSTQPKVVAAAEAGNESTAQAPVGSVAVLAADPLLSEVNAGEGAVWKPTEEQGRAVAAAGWTVGQLRRLTFTVHASEWGAPAAVFELLVRAFAPDDLLAIATAGVELPICVAEADSYNQLNSTLGKAVVELGQRVIRDKRFANSLPERAAAMRGALEVLRFEVEAAAGAPETAVYHKRAVIRLATATGIVESCSRTVTRRAVRPLRPVTLSVKDVIQPAGTTPAAEYAGNHADDIIRAEFFSFKESRRGRGIAAGSARAATRPAAAGEVQTLATSRSATAKLKDTTETAAAGGGATGVCSVGTGSTVAREASAAAATTFKKLAVAVPAAAAADAVAAQLIAEEEAAAAAKAAKKQKQKPVQSKGAKQVQPTGKDLGARAAASSAIRTTQEHGLKPKRAAAANRGGVEQDKKGRSCLGEVNADMLESREGPAALAAASMEVGEAGLAVGAVGTLLEQGGAVVAADKGLRKKGTEVDMQASAEGAGFGGGVDEAFAGHGKLASEPSVARSKCSRKATATAAGKGGAEQLGKQQQYAVRAAGKLHAGVSRTAEGASPNAAALTGKAVLKGGRAGVIDSRCKQRGQLLSQMQAATAGVGADAEGSAAACERQCQAVPALAPLGQAIAAARAVLADESAAAAMPLACGLLGKRGAVRVGTADLVLPVLAAAEPAAAAVAGNGSGLGGGCSQQNVAVAALNSPCTPLELQDMLLSFRGATSTYPYQQLMGQWAAVGAATGETAALSESRTPALQQGAWEANGKVRGHAYLPATAAAGGGGRGAGGSGSAVAGHPLGLDGLLGVLGGYGCDEAVDQPAAAAGGAGLHSSSSSTIDNDSSYSSSSYPTQAPMQQQSVSPQYHIRPAAPDVLYGDIGGSSLPLGMLSSSGASSGPLLGSLSPFAAPLQWPGYFQRPPLAPLLPIDGLGPSFGAAAATQCPATVPSLPIVSVAVPDTAQPGLSSGIPYMQTRSAAAVVPGPVGVQTVRTVQNSTLAGSADQQELSTGQATVTAAARAASLLAGGFAAGGGGGGAPVPSSVQCSRKLQKKAKEEGSLSSCIVCWEARPCVLLLPCKHLALCEACSELLKGKGSDCPMCRGPVTEHMVVFHV